MPLTSAAMKIAAKVAVQYKTTAATQPDRTQQKTHVGDKQCCILTSPAAPSLHKLIYAASQPLDHKTHAHQQQHSFVAGVNITS